MKSLIYLHGFNSSPQSQKAILTRDYFTSLADTSDNGAALSYPLNVEIPSLPPAPLAAISVVSDLVKSIGISNVAGFIGSSLGGYYSLYLQKFYSTSSPIIKTVLINPAIRPYELLQDYLGENENPYSGERFIVEPSHMEDLQSISVGSIADPKNTF